MKRIFSTTAAVVLIAAGSFALPAGAQADDAPNGDISTQSLCDGGATSDVRQGGITRAYVPGSLHLGGSPGQSVKITAGQSSTATATIGGSVAVNLGNAIASVKAEVNASASEANTVSASYEVSGVIPDQGGYIELGSDGYSVDYNQDFENHNCVASTLHGNALVPTNNAYGYASWTGFV